MKPVYKVCPKCGAVGCFKPFTDYTRGMIYIDNGIRTETIIVVDRVQCSSCKSTHALLADFLIPYGSYTLRFILHVLRAYFHRSCTVEALCEQFSIAIATLYKWKDLFLEHANLWLPVLKRMSQISIQSLDDFENIDKLPSSFFRRYGFSFLQSHQTMGYSRSPWTDKFSIYMLHNSGIPLFCTLVL